jgi:hypothetical protein
MSVIGWVTKINYLELLMANPAVYTCDIAHKGYISECTYIHTHQSALGPRGGLWPVLLVGNPYGKAVPQTYHSRFIPEEIAEASQAQV